jgi:opacity protein-like surface antigen
VNRRGAVAVSLAVLASSASARARTGSDGIVVPDFGEDAPRATAAPVEPPPPPEAPFVPELPPAPFGAAGQVVVSGGSSIGLSSTRADASNASIFRLSFSPAVDLFVVNNVSLGLDVTAAYSDAQGYGADGSLVDTTSSQLSVGVRFGVNVPLHRLWSLWPRLTLGVETVHQEITLVDGRTTSTAASALGTGTTTQSGPWVSATVPILFHVTPRFFVGAGPTFFHAFARAQEAPEQGGQRTTVGGALLVGGYWGGTRPDYAVLDTPAPLPSSEARLHRYGAAHQLVLSNDIGGGVSATSHTGTQSHGFSIGLFPALDYFLVDHVSVGLGTGVSYSDVSAIDSTTKATVTQTSTSLSVGPRLGADIPLGAWASLNPRATATLTSRSAALRSAGRANAPDETAIAIGLYVPLLLHPAKHAFVGFGPTLSHDISHTFDYGAPFRAQQILLSTVGASFTVGGWL